MLRARLAPITARPVRPIWLWSLTYVSSGCVHVGDIVPRTPPTGWFGGRSGRQHVGLEPRVAEGPARIQPLGQGGEVGAARVARARRSEELLAPMRPGAERRQRGLDLVQGALDRGRIALPREVDRQR